MTAWLVHVCGDHGFVFVRVERGDRRGVERKKVKVGRVVAGADRKREKRVTREGGSRSGAGVWQMCKKAALAC